MSTGPAGNGTQLHNRLQSQSPPATSLQLCVCVWEGGGGAVCVCVFEGGGGW